MQAPSEIHKAIVEICGTFPKSSKTYVGFIEPAEQTGVIDGTMQRATVSSMKQAWQVEDKAPTVTFAPTDEAAINYVRDVAERAAQSPCKMLVVIDLSEGRTSVWVLRKGMCFIATAAYGSPFATEVLVLSQFRDEVLLRSKLGRSFVRLYYAVSPPIALSIEGKKSFKVVIRTLLSPILCLVRTRMHR